MEAKLAPTFLTDLAEVYAALRPTSFSVAFLSDLAGVHADLSVASDAKLRMLASHFDKWRSETQELVRVRLAELPVDDPLLCPISLFGTMDYGRLETAHTRVLAWLLDPKREHGFKSSLITALIQRLFPHAFSELIVANVMSEFPIEGAIGKGRLDVLAEGSWKDPQRRGWVLVIEAKVDAGEGEDQLQKYETWLRSHAAGRELFRVFLTPHGGQPDTGAEDWETLSYLELVRIFRSVYDTLRQAQGFHFLRYYLAGVLQDVCHWPRNVTAGDADPYAIASYLKAVHDSNTPPKRKV